MPAIRNPITSTYITVQMARKIQNRLRKIRSSAAAAPKSL
jgi:hypothetical protein